MKKNNVLLLIIFQFILINNLVAAEKIPLLIEKNVPGAPQLLGIPFPKDKLQSSDNVRVLNAMGEEIPSQITIVNTWEPASNLCDTASELNVACKYAFHFVTIAQLFTGCFTHVLYSGSSDEIL